MFNNAFSLTTLDALTISSPYISIFPVSGFNKPIKHFNKTDFPEPDFPIITRDSLLVS